MKIICVGDEGSVLVLSDATDKSPVIDAAFEFHASVCISCNRLTFDPGWLDEDGNCPDCICNVTHSFLDVKDTLKCQILSTTF